MKPHHRRLSVDVPEDLYNEVLGSVQYGNQKHLVLNLLRQLAVQMKQGQRFLPADIAAGKRLDIRVS
jgi:hypothetical protein